MTASGRALATVLFTDIVGSTEHAAELRDAGWRDLKATARPALRADLTPDGWSLDEEWIYGHRRHTSQVVRYSTTDRSAAVVTTVECGSYVLTVRNN